LVLVTVFARGICPNLRPYNNHRQSRIYSKFRRISGSTQYAFGIEFALKRSYFYTLIDVSETILENTSVEYPDFASIPGGYGHFLLESIKDPSGFFFFLEVSSG